MPVILTRPYKNILPEYVQITTLNPLDKSGGSRLVLSNGDLTVNRPTSDGTGSSIRSILGMTTGKWYIEMTLDLLPSTAGQLYTGFTRASQNITGNPHQFTGINQRVSDVWSSGTKVGTTGLGWSQGSIMSYAADFDLNKVWFGRNGSYSGVFNGYLGGGNTWKFMVGVRHTPTYVPLQATVNFSGPFSYSPPVGF